MPQKLITLDDWEKRVAEKVKLDCSYNIFRGEYCNLQRRFFEDDKDRFLKYLDSLCSIRNWDKNQIDGMMGVELWRMPD